MCGAISSVFPAPSGYQAAAKSHTFYIESLNYIVILVSNYVFTLELHYSMTYSYHED